MSAEADRLVAAAGELTGRAEADWAGAAAFLEDALKLEPKRVELLDELARCRRNLGDYRGAVLEMTRLIERRPDAAAYCGRAQYRARLFDFAGALKDAEAALAKRPDDRTALTTASEARRALGELEAAKNLADAVIAVAPKDAWSFVVRSKVKRDAGDAAGACADNDAALALDARAGKAWAWKALALRDAGRSKEALTCLDQAVEVDANSAWLRFLRGDVRVELGERDGGMDDLLTAARTDPHASCDFDLLGSPSRAFFRHPKQAWVHAWRGDALRRKGMLESAGFHLDLALELAPDSSWIQSWRTRLQEEAAA